MKNGKEFLKLVQENPDLHIPANEYDEMFEQARKETAKEFAEFLISQMKERDYMGVKYRQGVFSENEIKDFVIQFLSEVEE